MGVNVTIDHVPVLGVENHMKMYDALMKRHTRLLPARAKSEFELLSVFMIQSNDPSICHHQT